MTVKTEAAAIVPTANAKAVVQAKGANISDLMQLLQQSAIDMQALVKQIIALHPSGGGDAANLTALNAILNRVALTRLNAILARCSNPKRKDDLHDCRQSPRHPNRRSAFPRSETNIKAIHAARIW